MLTSHGRHRYDELDSLRGVAAMVVVIGHHLMLWNAPYPRWWVLTYQSPLSILFDARDAVLVFFIMSGFVLFLPYVTPEGPTPYPRYLIKRTCRIYLPYLFALAFAIGMDLLTYRPLDNVFQKAAIFWSRPFPTYAIWPHILFIFNPPITLFNPSFWSLVHEMRLSIVFPLIALLALRLPFLPGILVGLAISYGGFHLPSTPSAANGTLAYSGLFLIGALIARHLPQIRAFNDRMSLAGRSIFVLLMFSIFKSSHFLNFLGNAFDDANYVPIHALACLLLVIFALTSIHFKRLLHSAPLRWVGKVSYSLYLLHAVIMWSLVSLFWQHTAHHLLLALVSITLSLVAAGIAFRWIERPAILLGRRLTGRPAIAPATAPLPVQP